jgi:titin
MRTKQWALACVVVLAGLSGRVGHAAVIPGVVYNSATGHYYKLYTTTATWTNAKAAAQAVGGYLACVTSASENTWLFQNVAAGGTPWLGATDEVVEGTWTWVSGETWSYTAWGAGEPNNSGNEDYVTFRTDGGWNDLAGGTASPYIVEWNTDPNVPADPANLRATNVTEARVDLAWDDLSSGETGFELERALGTGTFGLLGLPSANTVSYSDTNVTPETSYSYHVRANGSTGNSGWSNTLLVTTAPPTVASLAATALTARSVQLTWTDRASTETGVEIERGDGSPGAGFASLTLTNANATTYLDTTALPEHTYSYRARVVGAGGKSGYCAEASATTPLGNPVGLTLEATSDTNVKLTWEDTTSGETGFEIQRGTGSNPAFYSPLTLTAANVTTFDDNTVLPERAFSYRMRAVNASGASDWTPAKSVTTPPFAPSNASAVSLSADRVRITWTDNSHVERGHEIMRALAADSSFTLVANIGPNITTYDDLTAKQEFKYLYRVASVGDNGHSGWSVSNQVDTPAALVVRKATLTPAKGSKPARLTVTGEFDAGQPGVDVGTAASFGVGGSSVAVPSYVPKGSSLRYTAAGVRAQVTRGAAGSSRVAFALQVDSSLVTMPAADGDLVISYVNGAFRAVGTVQLAGGAFQPPKRGAFLDPPFNVVSISAALRDGADDTLSVKGSFHSATVPTTGPDLHIRFGTFELRIPGTDLTRSGDKWGFKEVVAHRARSVSLDYAKGQASIVLGAVELGSHAPGADPVRVTVEFGDVFFEDTPAMSSTGKSVKY